MFPTMPFESAARDLRNPEFVEYCRLENVDPGISLARWHNIHKPFATVSSATSVTDSVLLTNEQIEGCVEPGQHQKRAMKNNEGRVRSWLREIDAWLKKF